MELRLPESGASPIEIAEERVEMQDELDESWPVIGIALMTRSQAKGAVLGTLAFALTGLAVGVVAGIVWSAFDASISVVARFLVAIAVCVAGFATAGFFAGGAFNPRFEAADDRQPVTADRRTGAERNVLVAVHVDDSSVAEDAADVLVRCGAEHVHFVDAAGTPLPPQAAHPRPADPDGYWWRNAGQG